MRFFAGFFVGDGEADALPEPSGSGKVSGLVVGSPLGMYRLGEALAVARWASLIPETRAAPRASTLTTPPMISATASSAPMPTSSCLVQGVSSSSSRAMGQGCGTLPPNG